jgi:phage head maturation protease
MSIGYDVLKKEFDTIDEQEVRVLKELRVHEISLTMFPMNEQARVTEAKNFTLQKVVELNNKIKSLLHEPEDSTRSDEADELHTKANELQQALNQLSEQYG